jgi:hypothetical protein
MSKKKLIKHILWSMWIVYICVGLYSFIQNEKSKDIATTDKKDESLSVTSTTDSVADKNTDAPKRTTLLRYDKGNTSEHEDNDNDEKEEETYEMGEIDGYEVTNFDDQVPGDEYDEEFLGNRPDPELYPQDDEENK